MTGSVIRYVRIRSSDRICRCEVLPAGVEIEIPIAGTVPIAFEKTMLGGPLILIIHDRTRVSVCVLDGRFDLMPEGWGYGER